MKKTLMSMVLLVLVAGTVIMWFLNSKPGGRVVSILQIGIVVLLVIFAFGFIYNRLGNYQKGLPSEDELSKKMLKIAAARSYYFSLYLWLVLMYLQDKGTISSEHIISTGILGMAVLLGLHWSYLKITGIRNE